MSPPAFYLQWHPRVPESPIEPWYKRVRVGINPLKKMMPTISERAGLAVRYTNHSLRATAATRMFASGIPEKVVAEVTRHRSLKALRTYERTSEDQQLYYIILLLEICLTVLSYSFQYFFY